MTKVVELLGPLTSEVGDKVALAIRSATSVVDLRIDSPGGKLGAAVTINLEIEEHSAAVVTTVMGEACSAAALVALAGDKRRIAAKGTMMMHAPIFRVGECSSDEQASRAVDMMRIIAEYTGAAAADIRTWLRDERFFSAHEAQAAGLVDVISDAPLPVVLLRPPRKRAPARWLRAWREDFERLDLRPGVAA